jgi:hypothetical protein
MTVVSGGLTWRYVVAQWSFDAHERALTLVRTSYLVPLQLEPDVLTLQVPARRDRTSAACGLLDLHPNGVTAVYLSMR